MILLLLAYNVILLANATYSFATINNEITQTSASVPAIDYLHRILDGIDRALSFIGRSYQEANLDALIGTRLVEAGTSVLLRRLEAQNVMFSVPPSILYHINHLRLLSGKICENALPYVIASEPDYVANIGHILDRGLFELNYASRNLSQTFPVWPRKCKEINDKEISDNCIAELFGSRKGIACDISDFCWKQMTSLGYSQYSLSHELLYLEIGQQFGCQLELAWHIRENKQVSLARLQDTLCSNMLNEVHTIADDGFPLLYQDLFMEHVAFCGMLGYRDFFNKDWLEHILSWQDTKDGCYKKQTAKNKGSDCKHNRVHGRKKREEKTVAGGCQLHMTTVALGALTQYVRYILEWWLEDQM